MNILNLSSVLRHCYISLPGKVESLQMLQSFRVAQSNYNQFDWSNKAMVPGWAMKRLAMRKKRIITFNSNIEYCSETNLPPTPSPAFRRHGVGARKSMMPDFLRLPPLFQLACRRLHCLSLLSSSTFRALLFHHKSTCGRFEILAKSSRLCGGHGQKMCLKNQISRLSGSLKLIWGCLARFSCAFRVESCDT